MARRTNKCESAHATKKKCSRASSFHRCREAFLHSWLLFLRRKEEKKQEKTPKENTDLIPVQNRNNRKHEATSQ